MANQQATGTAPEEVREAQLDEPDGVWPVSYALTPEMTEAGEAEIRARIERAVGHDDGGTNGERVPAAGRSGPAAAGA